MENQRAEQAPPQPLGEVHPEGATPADDDLLGVIADVERQLSSLRSYRAQAEEARQRWQAADDELRERRLQLDRGAEELTAEREKLAEEHRRLQELDAGLNARAQQIERDFDTLAEEQRRAAESAQRRETDLASRAGTLEEREQRLAEHAASVSRHRESIQALETQIAERERAVADRLADIESRHHELAAAASRAEAAERTASERSDELAQARKQAAAAGERAENALRELQAARAEGDQARSRHEQELSGLRSELARAGEAQGDLMNSLHDRERKLLEAAERLKAAGADAERRAKALEESETRLAGFKRQLIERDTRIQDLSVKLAAATSKLREVSETMRQQDGLIDQSRNIEAELERRAARIADLEEQVAAAASRPTLDPEAAQVPSLLAERETLRLRADALEEQLLATQAQLEEASASNESLRAQLERSPHPVYGLMSGDIPAEVGEAIVLRWRRLRAMRSVLREQADKLRQASAAVRERYQQSEEFAAEREAIARERAALAQARQRPDQRRAAPSPGNRVVALASFAALATTALAALSWAVGGQLAPATYACRARIAVEPGAAANEAQLAEWQKYHESLLRDPALIDTAAERMGRRGIASLSTPGALHSRLGADMGALSPADGHLTIELRGRGAAETTRILDTYITALVSQSNASRERRTDGLAAVIAEAPNAGPGPISDPRLAYAAIVFVGSLSLCLAGSGFAIRRVSQAKSRFDREQQAQLQPAEWERAPQNIER